MQADFYKILQIDTSAEPEVITAAYKRLAQKYHPDKNHSAVATHRMQEITEAYRVLSDPNTRARYDSERSTHEYGSSSNEDFTAYSENLEIDALKKIAQQGNIKAQYELGKIYLEKDEVESVKWFRKAAEQGDAQAQCCLGWLYQNGKGVQQDYPESARWFQQAAEQGLAAAQRELGTLYRTGKGVQQDRAEATHWFHKAAEQGDTAAQFWFGFALDHGEGTRQDITQAVDWYHKASEQGDPKAQSSLGSHYLEGSGVPKDVIKAVHWLRKAAEQGDPVGQIQLGGIYGRGEGVPQDDAEGAKWFRKAAEQGITTAQYRLGMFYRNGWGVTQDNDEAAHWLQKAGEQGDAEAQSELGVMHLQGEGVEQNEAKAVEWTRKAAEQGCGVAECRLGVLYREGWFGVPQDNAKAVEWLRRAVEHGFARAEDELAQMYQQITVESDQTVRKPRLRTQLTKPASMENLVPNKRHLLTISVIALVLATIASVVIYRKTREEINNLVPNTSLLTPHVSPHQSPPSQPPIAQLKATPAQRSIDTPRMQVGDAYVMESIHHDAPQLNTIIERSVISVEQYGDFIVRSRNLKSGYIRTVEYTAQWNPKNARGSSGYGSEYSPPIGYFDFPLRPGKRWERISIEKNIKTGSILKHKLSGIVGDWEVVSVPAGTFRGIRVTLQTEILDNTAGRVTSGEDISWYVPDVKRSVKSEITTVDPVTRKIKRQTIQLLSYRLK